MLTHLLIKFKDNDNMGAEGAKMLSEALAVNSTLTTLDVDSMEGFESYKLLITYSILFTYRLQHQSGRSEVLKWSFESEH